MVDVVETCDSPASSSPFWLITLGFLTSIFFRVFISTSGVGPHEYVIDWIYRKTGFKLSLSKVFCCCTKNTDNDGKRLKIPKDIDQFPDILDLSLDFEARNCYELKLIAGYYRNVAPAGKTYVYTNYSLISTHCFRGSRPRACT